MDLHAVRRSTLDNTLKLARLPFDTALRLIPGDALGSKSAAKRMVERVDALVRAVVVGPLPETGRAYEAHERPEAPPQAEPRTTRRGQYPQRERMGNPTKPQRAVAVRGRASSRVAPPARPAAPAPHAPPPPSAPPSQEEIAARAYQMYERGVPGGADAHWQLAERELSSRQS